MGNNILKYFIFFLCIGIFIFSCQDESTISDPNTKNIEPSWLPSELKGLHPYNGTWSREYSFERMTYNNFEEGTLRDLIDELVGVASPGYKGIENAVGSNYGASYEYFPSINSNNIESIITYAKTYALEYYLNYILIKNHLDQRGDIIYSILYNDDSLDENVYKPFSTVTQVSSRLWIYEINYNTIAIIANGTVNHDSSNEKTFVRVGLYIPRQRQIGSKSGYIYTFTPEEGEAIDYDSRTILYY